MALQALQTGDQANEAFFQTLADEVNSKAEAEALDDKVDKSTGLALSQNSYTDAEKTKLGGIATGATANDTDANLKNRANHTGSQAATTITEDATHRFATDAEKTTWNGKEPAITVGATTQYIRGDKSLATLNADVVPDGTTNKAYTATEKTKLGGVATGATVNDTDANLKNRANHTGSQAATTITEDSTHRFATDAEKTGWSATATSITALTNIYQPETIAYAQAIVAAGSRIDIANLAAVDAVIGRARRKGYLSKFKTFLPFNGQSLAGALVPVMNPAALTAFNFVEADYIQNIGLSAGTGNVINSTKYIDLGYDLVGAGLSHTNVSMSVGMPETQPTGIGSGNYVGGAIATFPPSGNSDIGISLNYASFPGPIALAFEQSVGINISGSSVTGWRNGGKKVLATTVSLSSAPGNLNLFRCKQGGGSNYFSPITLGVVIVTSALTDAEMQDLNLAVIDYLVATGRSPLATYIPNGDSITEGSGAVSYPGYAVQVARALGMKMRNLGIGGSQFRQPNSNAPGGYQRYTDIIIQKPSLSTFMYGTNDIGGDVTTNGDATIIADMATKMTTTLTAFQAAGIRVIVLSPPYRGSSANSTKLYAYVKAQSDVCVALRIPFVDMVSPFYDTGNPNSFFADLLHPNDAGHAMITARTLAAMQGRIYRDAPLDFTSISAASYQDLTVTMYSAQVGQEVAVVLPVALASSGLQVSAWVSALDTVTVRLYNPTGSAVDPASAAFRVTVFIDR